MSQDPRIEPAAKALWDHGKNTGTWNWYQISEDTRERYQAEARAALAAADKAATITTVAGLDALPAGSRIMLHCDLLLRSAEVVDESNWIDLGNACPVDNDSLRMALGNLGPARVVHWGQP